MTLLKTIRQNPSLLEDYLNKNLTKETILTMAMDIDSEFNTLSEDEKAKLRGEINPVLRYLRRDKETKTYLR